jgi:hypothetical protein
MPRGSRSNGTPDLRALLLHYVRSKGSTTTIAELLADPVAGPFVPSLTVGDLGGGRTTESSTPRRGQSRASPRGRASGKASTRTAEGREGYDAEVLAAIKAVRGPAAAEDVIKTVGGTGLQFRTATKRLIASREIKRTGKARGTRYVAR